MTPVGGTTAWWGKQALAECLEKYHIHPRRSHGQNFLVQARTANSIVDAAGVTKKDHVIEIGAGLGALTGPLAERAHCVTAFEIDEPVYQACHDRLGRHAGITLLHRDGTRFEEFLDSHIVRGPVKLISNLPYAVYQDILKAALGSRVPFVTMTFVIQSEVYRKLASRPGDGEYGPVSVLVQSLCLIKRDGPISRHSFYPAPRVDSILFTLTPRRDALLRPDEVAALWPRLVFLFTHRRKIFKNVLAGAGKRLLDEIPVLLRNRRVEEWTLENVVDVARQLRSIDTTFRTRYS